MIRSLPIVASLFDPLSRALRQLAVRVVVERRAVVWFALLWSLSLAAGCTPAPLAPGPVIEITASYPAADAQVVVDSLAAPIEQSVNGVEWQQRLESEARNDGTYRVRVYLDPTATLPVAEALVQNRVSMVTPILAELVRQQGITVKRIDLPTMPPSATLVLFDESNSDHAGLQRWARAVAQRFGEAGSVVTARPAPDANEVPRLRLSIDRGACVRLGVDYAEVDQVLRQADSEAGAETFQQAELTTRSGEKVRLTAVATIEMVSVPELICRYNLCEAYYFTGPIPPGKTAAETLAAWQKLADEDKPAGSAAELQAVVFAGP